jgi:hypothetical protein
MKRQWQIRRQFQPTADAARRWDQAYHMLLQWSQWTGFVKLFGLMPSPDSRGRIVGSMLPDRTLRQPA